MNLPATRVGAAPECCPYCLGRHIVRKGLRKKKLETVQLWRCNDCQKVFTPLPLRGKTFPLPVILQGITLYNLGYPAKAACRLVSERTGLTVTESSLARWVGEHQALCAYSRLRDDGRRLFAPAQIIRSVKLYHQQVYEFSIHRAKLALLTGTTHRAPARFAPVGDYLMQMLRRCPHRLFRTTLRASQAKTKAHFDLEQVSITEKQNFATRTAHLVVPSAPSNKLRHETLQRFMLANDSVTVATEVPVFLMPEDVEHLQRRLGFAIPLNLTEPLTGHVDFLQIRNGAVHILDYKPNAKRDKPIEQLTLYALALSRATGLRLFDFKCAWFDENHYYEFFPLHVVYKLK